MSLCNVLFFASESCFLFVGLVSVYHVDRHPSCLDKGLSHQEKESITSNVG